MGDRTVADKLLIRPGATVWTSHAERLSLIGGLPAGLTVVGSPAEATIAIVFAGDAGSLRNVLDAQLDKLARPDTLWVAYPKGNRSDVNRDSVWPMLAEYGMRPIGQVAVDAVWSALQFRQLKAGEAPFTGGR